MCFSDIIHTRDVPSRETQGCPMIKRALHFLHRHCKYNICHTNVAHLCTCIKTTTMNVDRWRSTVYYPNPKTLNCLPIACGRAGQRNVGVFFTGWRTHQPARGSQIFTRYVRLMSRPETKLFLHGMVWLSQSRTFFGASREEYGLTFIEPNFIRL